MILYMSKLTVRISMGSPLGPVMANIFMTYFEFLLQERYNLTGMKYWSRYVDDVVAIFYFKQDLTTILQELSSIHENIKNFHKNLKLTVYYIS